jgi:hypothetical protein
MKHNVISINVAKNIFQVCVLNQHLPQPPKETILEMIKVNIQHATRQKNE